MMGYTHIVTSTAVSLAIASVWGDGSPGLYMSAIAFGSIGGIAVDAEVKDKLHNPKITDAGRSRLAVVGLIGICVLFDYIFHYGLFIDFVTNNVTAIAGLIAFIVLVIIGFFTPHRTFTHSLLYVFLTTGAVYLFAPHSSGYYLVGCLVHLILDMLNNPFQGHGVWLLFPFLRGKGIALKVCKSGGMGNKIIFFVGLAISMILSIYYVIRAVDFNGKLSILVTLVYVGVITNLVRIKSEKELKNKYS